MNVEITSRSMVALGQELMALFKAHSRIFHCDEDVLIQHYIISTIEQIESNTGMVIFPTAAIITAAADDFTDKGLRLPPPVNTWSSDPADGYTLRREGLGPISITYLAGTAADVAVTINCGYATVAAMPPSLVQGVLKAAGNAYEYREIYTPTNLEMKPDWWTNAMSGFWNPEV